MSEGDHKKRELPEELECPICLGHLRNAVETSCGHALCSACFVALWDKSQRMVSAVCPVDRAKIRFVVPSYTIRALVHGRHGGHVTEEDKKDNFVVEQYNIKYEGFSLRWFSSTVENVRRLGSGFGSLSSGKKAAIFVGFMLVLIYLFSSVDLVPDSLGILGLIDDLIVFWIFFVFLATYARVEGV